MKTAIALGLLTVALSTEPAQAQDMAMPTDAVALRYRIERLDKETWKAEKAGRRFKRNETIRFRFMSNTAGSLYVLNSSEDSVSLHPIFAEGEGAKLRAQLGLGTHVDANQVGVFPSQDKGGGMRFTGVKGQEKFLFVYVPDEMESTRAMMAIVPGAEGWHFDDNKTYMVTGELAKMLFSYFELKSK